MKIVINDLDKFLVIIALYENAKKSDTSRNNTELQKELDTLSIKKTEKLLDETSYIEHINAIFIGIDFSDMVIDTTAYDKNNLGGDAKPASLVVEDLRTASLMEFKWFKEFLAEDFENILASRAIRVTYFRKSPYANDNDAYLRYFKTYGFNYINTYESFCDLAKYLAIQKNKQIVNPPCSALDFSRMIQKIETSNQMSAIGLKLKRNMRGDRKLIMPEGTEELLIKKPVKTVIFERIERIKKRKRSIDTDKFQKTVNEISQSDEYSMTEKKYLRKFSIWSEYQKCPAYLWSKQYQSLAEQEEVWSSRLFVKVKPIYSKKITIGFDIDNTLAIGFEDNLEKLIEQYPWAQQIIAEGRLIMAMLPHLLNKGWAEFIQLLILHPNIDILFCSKGNAERNFLFVREFLCLVLDEARWQKIKNHIEIKTVSRNNKKNYANIANELSQTIFIDDVLEDTLPEQMKCLLKIPPVDKGSYELIHQSSDEKKPFYAVNNAFFTMGLLLTACELSENTGGLITEHLHQLQFKDEIYDESIVENMSYYEKGLQKLREINPELDYYHAESLVDDVSLNQISIRMK